MNDLAKRLAEVKDAAGGMLPLEVYERLYIAARNAGGGAFVEIGSAGGAATVVLALGAKDGGAPFHIWTVDPMDRGSRKALGSIEENVAFLRGTLRRFDVASDVSIVTGEVSNLPITEPSAVSLLLLDADGQIDRDLGALDDRLRAGALVIIDDVEDRTYALRDATAPGRWLIDQKHRLTLLLAQAFCARGWLVHEETVGRTQIYRRGSTPMAADELTEVALNAYRKLTFGSINASEFGFSGLARRIAARRLPLLGRVYRTLRDRIS